MAALTPAESASVAVHSVADAEYGRILATVIGAIGDWTVAEDAVQDALARALERWPLEGTPRNPAAWITTVAKRRAIDLMRHEDAARRASARWGIEREVDDPPSVNEGETFPDGDGRLRLIFTACHPALPAEVRTALTLRAVLNISVESLGRLFGVSEAAMQKRLVRARGKIKHARIPFRVPGEADLVSRSNGVRDVLYGLFTIAYAEPLEAPSVDDIDPAVEAIRLARLCCSLIPERTHERVEFDGLLALMLLQHSRRLARISAQGTAVAFVEQDRDLWDEAAVSEGLVIVDKAFEDAARYDIPAGRHLVQAAIAAEYVRARVVSEIDHQAIVALFLVLEELEPSPFVRLNRAIAEANAGDPSAAMAMLEGLRSRMNTHHLFHAAVGDLMQRLGEIESAIDAFREAARLAHSEVERRSYHAVAAKIHDSERMRVDHAR